MMTGVLSVLSGRLLDRLLQLAQTHLDRTAERGRLSAGLAAEEIRAEIKARAEARKVLIAESGYLFSAGRIGRLAFVLPLALWWSAVCLDSVFRFGWAVAEVPVLRDWGGVIVASLFLADGVKSLGRIVRAR